MWIIYLFISIYNVASLVPINEDPWDDDDEDILNLSSENYWLPLYPMLNCTAPCENCTAPPCMNCTEMIWTQQPCGDTTPLWRSTNFQLMPNSSYIETFMLGNGNCSDDMNFTDSVFLVVETMGFWIIDVMNDTWPEGWDNDEEDDDMPLNGGIIVDGDHTVENHPEIKEFESNWYHVYFTPIMFNVTIFNERDFYYSNVTDFYYRNMTDLYANNMTEGYCMPILDYWNNGTVGCPCNDTWNTTGYYNSSTNSFMGGRQIIPSQCSNDSCREMMFLNDTMKYSNVRINITECYNGSVLKTVEFTKMSYEKDMGYTYGVQDIGYIFGAWNQKKEVHTLIGENDTFCLS